MPPISLRALSERLTRLDPDDIMQRAVAATADDLIRLNRQQLLQGKDAQGKPLKAYARPAKGGHSPYAIEKNSMNAMPGIGIPDLNLTGAFQDAMTVSANGDSVSVASTDSKTNMLVARYGDIFGLDAGSMKKYRALLQPEIVKRIADITRLRIIS